MALANLSGPVRSAAAGLRSPLSIRLATIWLVAVVAIGTFAPLLAPHDYLHQSPLERFLPPWLFGGQPAYLFGTDYLGRDVLSNLVIATRTSLVVAILGSLICAVLGTALGFIAAHFGGIVDNLIMGFSDAMASVPFIIFALAVLAFLGSDPLIFIGLVGIASWERYARLTRGLVLDAATNGYAEAVRIIGAAPVRVYGRHILPNIVGPLMVQLTINFPEIILLESGLSFLGLGIKPPLTSLGLMVAEGRDYVAIAWWLCALPGLVILLTTLSVSLLGDHLRDRFDARLR